MRLIFPVELTEDEYEDGSPALLVTFPDLPETITSGRNREEALANAADCLAAALAWRLENQMDIPEPSPAHGRPTVAPAILL